MPAAAGAAPAGWKVIKDRKGNCQMVVPIEWKGKASTAYPEDRQAMAAIHLLPGKDWAESKAMAERFMVPQEVVEDGPERFWIVYALRAERNPADAEEKPSAGRAAAPKPAGGRPAASTPATDEPVASAPATGKPAASAPAPAGAVGVKPSEVGWYVSVPGPLGPCTAQITFKTADLAETVREIALSVAAVSPAP